ncbi:hypothetical protein [Streptomyces pimonensis]
MPPELARETETYAVGHDTGLRYSPGGALSADGRETGPGARVAPS